jgi:hypothetical protein
MTLPTRDAQYHNTVVQPDVFITGDCQKLDYRGMRGAPDWLAAVPGAIINWDSIVTKIPASWEV